MRDYARVLRKVGRKQDAVALERQATSLLRSQGNPVDATVGCPRLTPLAVGPFRLLRNRSITGGRPNSNNAGVCGRGLDLASRQQCSVLNATRLNATSFT
jgi:hypothetical protein